MKAFNLQGEVHRLARLAERQAPEVARARPELARRIEPLRVRGVPVQGSPRRRIVPPTNGLEPPSRTSRPRTGA